MPSQPNNHKDSSENSNALLVKDLFDKITIAAKNGDFNMADQLRNKLIETYPTAIGEAIKTAELIENEMSAAIDKDHLAIFGELYELLTIEERNCIFYSLKKLNIPEKKLLLKKGSLNKRLFFIEKGTVNIGVPLETGKLRIIAQLGRGQILGEYSFATIALCSATAATKTKVQLRCLESKKTEEWENKHPGLLDKIVEYCRKHGNIDHIATRREREEHTYQRHPVQGNVKALLLDESDKKTDISFNGELEEISRSGTSFTICCNSQEKVKKLLTKTFYLDITCGKKGNEIRFQNKGKVVHVSPLMYNDYIFHISFNTTLPEAFDRKISPDS